MGNKSVKSVSALQNYFLMISGPARLMVLNWPAAKEVVTQSRHKVLAAGSFCLGARCFAFIPLHFINWAVLDL
jgi:hypothetical protein